MHLRTFPNRTASSSVLVNLGSCSVVTSRVAEADLRWDLSHSEAWGKEGGQVGAGAGAGRRMKQGRLTGRFGERWWTPTTNSYGCVGGVGYAAPPPPGAPTCEDGSMSSGLHMALRMTTPFCIDRSSPGRPSPFQRSISLSLLMKRWKL